jgi:integrase
MQRSLVPAHEVHVSFQDKQRHTSDMLGFNTSILTGQLAESTQNQYAQDLYDYLAFAGTRERALDPATFSLWRTQLSSKERFLSPNTINRMLSAVKRMMLEAEEKKLVPQGTAVEFRRVRGVKTAALKERLKVNARVRIEPEAMRQMTEVPDLERLIGLRDLAILHTFAGSGLRVSDLCQVTMDRIKRRGRGYVVEVRGKNEVEYDAVPLTKRAYEAISDWLAARPISSPYVFTGFGGRGEGVHSRLSDQPLTRQGVWQIIKGYVTRVGLPEAKPHDLRRFVGTQLAKVNPRMAQKVLRHKSIETTFKHYVLDDIEEDVTENLY